MAFNANHVTEEHTNNITLSKSNTSQDSNQLDSREIIFLLEVLKKSQFVGEQVEIVYTSILKLQNQYIAQTKK
jgi:hypothetical protein